MASLTKEKDMGLLIAAHLIARKECRDYDYYGHHLVGVATMVEESGSDHITQAVAILHDVIEDTDYTINQLEQELIERGAGYVEVQFTVKAVDLLTKKVGLTHKEYIDAILQNNRAAKVKYYDSLFNLNSCVKDGDFKRAKKYLKNMCLLKDYM